MAERVTRKGEGHVGLWGREGCEMQWRGPGSSAGLQAGTELCLQPWLPSASLRNTGTLSPQWVCSGNQKHRGPHPHGVKEHKDRVGKLPGNWAGALCVATHPAAPRSQTASLRLCICHSCALSSPRGMPGWLPEALKWRYSQLLPNTHPPLSSGFQEWTMPGPCRPYSRSVC